MKWERNRNIMAGDLIPYFEKVVSLMNMGFKSGDQLFTPSSDETFWDKIRTDLLPILTFTTTLVFFYYTYQQQTYIMQQRR